MVRNLDQIKWWQDAFVYQIYPLSFCDSNDDGIGDIPGIISKLDYLKNLGVDVIWLSPVYSSPMDDNGYDIRDYYQIDPLFGTMEDFLTLLHEVHLRGMKLIMDLVVNHTSDEHRWFQESRKSIDNPYRDYYVWRDVPSAITSVFSGPAWELDPLTNQYYFHLFSKRQPDLNWDNPNLRNEIYQMINFWLDQGIDGFRLDVIDLIGKDIDHFQLCDGPFLNQRLHEMFEACFKGRDVMTVGETPCLSASRVRDITGGNEPLLNMVFQFGHVGLDEVPGQGKWNLKKLDLVELKRYFKHMQTSLYQTGWNSLFWANHDQPRAVSRYGNLQYRYESATMLATVLYGMQGTPYVYQGEELGMTGVNYTSLNQFKDIETHNMVKEKLALGWSMDDIMTSIYAKGRDNSRSPMQWDSSPYAGFSNVAPWMDVNPNYQEINAVCEQESIRSVFHYYQELFQIRKSNETFTKGSFELLEETHPSLFLYKRLNENYTLLVIGSFSDSMQLLPVSLPTNGKWLIKNQDTFTKNQNTSIPPYFAGIYEYKSQE